MSNPLREALKKLRESTKAAIHSLLQVERTKETEWIHAYISEHEDSRLALIRAALSRPTGAGEAVAWRYVHVKCGKPHLPSHIQPRNDERKFCYHCDTWGEHRIEALGVLDPTPCGADTPTPSQAAMASHLHMIMLASDAEQAWGYIRSHNDEIIAALKEAPDCQEDQTDA